MSRGMIPRENYRSHNNREISRERSESRETSREREEKR